MHDRVQMLSACPPFESLSAFVAGRAVPAEMETIACHLESCDACTRRLLESDENSDGLVDRLRQHLSGPFERATDVLPLIGNGGRAGPYERQAETFPRAFGSYLLLGKLGQGGMGIVYKARDQLKRIVALKIAVTDPWGDKESLRQRFHVEGEAIARLEHDNIVRLFEFGEEFGQPYFSMEFVDGPNLAARFRQGPLPPREVAQLTTVLAAAVQVAHDAAVVHRDLKPANVLIDQSGRVKLTDFGLAKLLDGDQGNTRADIVIGTAAYMSPEQTRGGIVGPATDIYSLGAILYEGLTGRPPFAGETRAETIDLVRHKPPETPRSIVRQIPLDLEAICLKCLEKSPSERYATAADLAADLGRWLAGESPSIRRTRWRDRLRRAGRSLSRPIVGVGLSTALIALAATAFLQLQPSKAPHSQENAELQQLEERLAAGGNVTLIDRLGGPKWHQWRTDPTCGSIKITPDSPTAVSSFGIALLELAPRVPAVPFRFSAELKHQRANEAAGFVGIYVSYRETATPMAPLHQMIGLQFREILPYDTPRFDIKDTPVRLLPRFLAEKQQRLVWGATFAGHSERYGVAGPSAQSEWRRLELLVHEKRIEARWDGKPVGPLDLERVARDASEFVGHSKAKLDPVFQPFVEPRFNPKGGIGVIVSNGMVSVRSAVVQFPHSKEGIE